MSLMTPSLGHGGQVLDEVLAEVVGVVEAGLVGEAVDLVDREGDAGHVRMRIHRARHGAVGQAVVLSPPVATSTRAAPLDTTESG